MGTEEQREKFITADQDFARLNLQLIALSYEMQQILRGEVLPQLPTPKGDMLRFLYENALQESRERVNLGPYTSVFECLLGPPVQTMFDWMEQVSGIRFDVVLF